MQPIKFNDLFKVYVIRNLALQALALRAFEFGKNLAISPSAGLTNGLDPHTLHRQQEYVAWMEDQIGVVAESPTMDMPQTHPVDLEVNLSEQYETFLDNSEGGTKPINEDVQNLARQWMFFAVEIVKCNSAGLPSGLIAPDTERLLANCESIDKFLQHTSDAGILDLPESSFPSAPLAKFGANSK